MVSKSLLSNNFPPYNDAQQRKKKIRIILLLFSNNYPFTPKSKRHVYVCMYVRTYVRTYVVCVCVCMIYCKPGQEEEREQQMIKVIQSDDTHFPTPSILISFPLGFDNSKFNVDSRFGCEKGEDEFGVACLVKFYRLLALQHHKLPAVAKAKIDPKGMSLLSVYLLCP